jgi:hypothetical protein
MSKFSGLSTADLTRMIEYYAQKNVDLETSFLVLQITSANKEKDLTQKYYDEKNEINIAHKKELELINETFNKKINKLESDLNKKKKLVNKD